MLVLHSMDDMVHAGPLSFLLTMQQNRCARCADQTSPAIARRSLEHGAHMAPLLHYIATGPKPDMADAWANATALEQMRHARPRQDWLCSLGAATMKKAGRGARRNLAAEKAKHPR